MNTQLLIIRSVPQKSEMPRQTDCLWFDMFGYRFTDYDDQQPTQLVDDRQRFSLVKSYNRSSIVRSVQPEFSTRVSHPPSSLE